MTDEGGFKTELEETVDSIEYVSMRKSYSNYNESLSKKWLGLKKLYNDIKIQYEVKINFTIQSPCYLDFDENNNIIRLDYIKYNKTKNLKEIIRIADKYYNIHPKIKDYANLPVNKKEVYL